MLGVYKHPSERFFTRQFLDTSHQSIIKSSQKLLPKHRWDLSCFTSTTPPTLANMCLLVSTDTFYPIS